MFLGLFRLLLLRFQLCDLLQGLFSLALLVLAVYLLRLFEDLICRLAGQPVLDTSPDDIDAARLSLLQHVLKGEVGEGKDLDGLIELALFSSGSELLTSWRDC